MFALTLKRRLHGLAAAVQRLPDRQGWLETVGLAALYGGFVLIVGRRAPWLKPGRSTSPLTRTMARAALLLVLPALGEELIFRGLLIPHPDEPLAPRPLALNLAAGQFAFVLRIGQEETVCGPRSTVTASLPANQGYSRAAASQIAESILRSKNGLSQVL
jgi:predicted Abi (CAAX) family protease